MGTVVCSVMIVTDTVAPTPVRQMNWLFFTALNTTTLLIIHLCRNVNSDYTTTKQLDINTYLRYKSGLFLRDFLVYKTSWKRVNHFDHSIKCKTVVEFRFLPSLDVLKPKYNNI